MIGIARDCMVRLGLLLAAVPLALAQNDNISHAEPLVDESDGGGGSDRHPLSEYVTTAAAQPDRHIFYGSFETVAFDDNLFTSKTDKTSAVFVDTTLSIAAGWGHFVDLLQDSFHVTRPGEIENVDEESFFFARWNPDWTYFFGHTGENRVNHDFTAFGSRALGKLKTSLETHAQSLSDTVTDVGTRTDRSIFSGLLMSQYQVAAKTSFASTLSYERDDYHNLLDISQWLASGWIAYDLAPKTQVGLGGSYGELSVHRGVSQSFEQTLVKGTYLSSEKLRFDLNVGIESRKLAQAMDRRTIFIFDLSGTYQIRANSEVDLRASRATRGSADDPNQNVVETTYQLESQTRVYQKLSLGFSGGLRWSSYYLTQAENVAPRDDHYAFISTQAAIDFTKHGNVRIFYEYKNNRSTVSNLGFAENRAGVETRFIF